MNVNYNHKNIYNSVVDANGTRSGSGFTLVELLVVLFLTGMLLTALFTLFDWHGKMYSYQQGLVKVSQSARAASQELFEYVSQANQVLATRSVNGTVYASDNTTIVVRLPSINASGDLIDGKWDHAAFYSSGTQLFETVEPDPSSSRKPIAKRQLSDTLLSVSYTYNNATFTQVTKVSVDISTSEQVRSQTVGQRLTEDLYLKNYY